MPTVILNNRLAFPTALGAAKDITGGRGGVIRYVTTLADSGAGSFRDVVTQSGAAIIIFNVSGYIDVRSKISPSSNKTIAAETSFRYGGQGITLRQDPNNRFDGPLMGGPGGNIIIRFLRWRAGDNLWNGSTNGNNNVPFQFTGGYMSDHCSYSWASDQNMDAVAGDNVTFQYCINSEGLYYASHGYNHPSDPAGNFPSPHGKGGIIGSIGGVSLIGNLYANNDDRNHLIQIGSSAMYIEFINNYIYNRGQKGLQFQVSRNTGAYNINLIGNYVKNGPQTSTNRWAISIEDNAFPASCSGSICDPFDLNRHSMFVSDNIDEQRRPTSNLDEWAIIGGGGNADNPPSTTARNAYETTSLINMFDGELSAISAASVDSDILNHAGASLYRDAVDERAVRTSRNNSGTHVNGHPEPGNNFSLQGSSLPTYLDVDGGIGYPTLQNMSSYSDTNGDGVPDDFVSAYDIVNTAGYTPLELYLAEIAGDFERLSGVTVPPIPLIKGKSQIINFF